MVREVCVVLCVAVRRRGGAVAGRLGIRCCGGDFGHWEGGREADDGRVRRLQLQGIAGAVELEAGRLVRPEAAAADGQEDLLEGARGGEEDLPIVGFGAPCAVVDMVSEEATVAQPDVAGGCPR